MYSKEFDVSLLVSCSFPYYASQISVKKLSVSNMVHHFQILSISLITTDYPIENTLSGRFTGKVFEGTAGKKKKMFEDAGRVIGFVMKSDQV